MPVSAVSFGERLNDLPAPPLGPGSRSEATGPGGGGGGGGGLSDIAQTCARRGDFVERLVLVVRPPRSPPAPLVTACPSSTPCHLRPVHRPAVGALSACLSLPGREGTEGALALLALQWTPGLALARPAGRCSGSRAGARAPGALSSHWAGSPSAGGLWPHEGNANTVCSQVTGGPRPENAWETLTDPQPTR